MCWILTLLDKLFVPLSVVAIVGVVAACLAHLLIFGAHLPELAKGKKDVKRLSAWERLIHIATLLSFVTLAITGFIATFSGGSLTGDLRLIHLIAAPIFSIGLACIAFTWAEDCAFGKQDLEWAKVCGGYLFHVEHIPAGRFNAGQKGFFWGVAVLGVVCMLSGAARVYPFMGATVQNVFYQAHRYSSLLLVVFVLAHIYLGTAANPGTWQSAFTGYVGMRWAQKHHPLWWAKIDKS